MIPRCGYSPNQGKRLRVEVKNRGSAMSVKVAATAKLIAREVSPVPPSCDRMATVFIFPYLNKVTLP